MNVLLLDSYDQSRVERLRAKLDSQWSITTSAHSAPIDELMGHIEDADAIVTQYWHSTTPAAPKVKLIQLPGAGFDAIDFAHVPAECTVCNVFEHEIGIAEYVVLALLESQIHLAHMHEHLRAGNWRDGFLTTAPFHGELYGKRVGFIGFGHIAREAAKRLKPFGVDIWARTRSPEKVDEAVCARKNVGPIAELDSMLEACEFIVVTCPLTEQTRGLIDARRLALMGTQAVLINVARGPIVDENALFEALSNRSIGGAVIDTWYDYPDPSSSPELQHRPAALPFHTLDNITMSSHASGWTDALFQRRFDVIANNLERLRKGEPLHNVLRAPGESSVR